MSTTATDYGLTYRYEGPGAYRIMAGDQEVGDATRRRGGYWRVVIYGINGDAVSSSWAASREEGMREVLGILCATVGEEELRQFFMETTAKRKASA